MNKVKIIDFGDGLTRVEDVPFKGKQFFVDSNITAGHKRGDILKLGDYDFISEAPATECSVCGYVDFPQEHGSCSQCGNIGF